MPRNREQAAAEFKRMLRVIALCGVVLTGLALWYLSLFGPLRFHMVIATVAGVFVSVALGCGLFAAAFFSDKSGHDQDVDDVTKRDRWDRRD